MCAIFGFLSHDNARPVRVEALAAIVRGNILRGPHSFGFAWIDRRGRLRCYKQTGRLTDHLGVLAMARGATMLIGHLRFATHGSAESNINNHPHPADGGWIVHNGIITNYKQLVRTNRLWPVSECDSEILGHLIERDAGTAGTSTTSILHRCARSIEATDGALAMLGLWSRPGVLMLARRGNPLHWTRTRDGVYLASLAEGLPGDGSSRTRPAIIPANHAQTFTRGASGWIARTRTLRAPRVPVLGGLFDRQGNYCGG